MMPAILALTAVLAVAVYFLARIARCMETDLSYRLDLQERQGNERKYRRERAEKELSERRKRYPTRGSKRPTMH